MVTKKVNTQDLTSTNAEVSLDVHSVETLLRTIVTKMVTGEGDEGLVKGIVEDLDQTTVGMKEEEKPVFYAKAEEIFTVFFGVEHNDERRLTEMIRPLIRKVFPELFEGEDEVRYVKGDRIKVLKDRISEEIHRLIAESQKDKFDLRTFINDFLFEGKEAMEMEALFAKLASVGDGTPEDVTYALRGVLNGMKGKMLIVSKKVIAGALKRSHKHAAEEKADDPKIPALKDLLAFVESLENKRMSITDFHILDYLRDYVDATTAGHLMEAKPQTLAGAVVESRYNGNHLAHDAFTSHFKGEAMSKAVISSISKKDFKEIVACLVRIASGDLDIEDLSLRTGIGASDKDVPLRILSYAIPSLTIARRFQEKYGKSPRVDFFTGQEGGIACNGMPLDLVRANTETAFRITKDFVHTFFPDVAGQFSLVDDKEWSHPQTQLMVAYLESVLIEAAERGDDPYLEKIVRELRRRGQEYGEDRGAGNSLKYAAFHVICFRDVPTINAYIDGNQGGQNHIVSIGGSSEKEFDHVRDVLTAKFSVEDFNRFAVESGKPEMRIQAALPNLGTRSSLIADTGVIPPYFLVNEVNDIALPELEGLEPNQVRDLFAQRIQSALTKTHQGVENDPRTVSGARSLVQGMALLASTIGRESLVDFIQHSIDAK